MINLKIIFIGTSDFAVPILKNLIKNNYNIISVITAPDKPTGRKQELTPSPVKKTALENHLPVLQPEKISEISQKISTAQPSLIIVAAYGKIIPKSILEMSQFGCLNLHPSLLPKYRGPSPIQTALLNNDKTSGITLMLMNEQIDHGPIIAQKEMAIDINDNYQTLEKKLAVLAADFLIETLPLYLQSEIKPQPQDESQVSYSKILTKEDGRIDWQKSAQEIENMVRAFYPWPGAWTEFNGLRVKILKAKAIEKQTETTFPTGQGFLLLETVQPAGKKPMSGEEFFRGYQPKISNIN